MDFAGSDRSVEAVELLAGRGRRSLASGFTLLSFGDLGEPDIAYVEQALGAVHLQNREDVALAGLKFDQLLARALGPAQSQALVERVADQT